jgi:hypothetical protein
LKQLPHNLPKIETLAFEVFLIPQKVQSVRTICFGHSTLLPEHAEGQFLLSSNKADITSEAVRVQFCVKNFGIYEADPETFLLNY